MGVHRVVLPWELGDYGGVGGLPAVGSGGRTPANDARTIESTANVLGSMADLHNMSK